MKHTEDEDKFITKLPLGWDWDWDWDWGEEAFPIMTGETSI